MMLDEMKYFKKVEDMTTYVRNGLLANRFTIDEVFKFARITAVQGTLGEEVITKLKNGLEETKNVVKADEKTGEPGWIVTNPDGERYIVEDSDFRRKYEIDPENPSKYKPVGGPVLSTRVNENIEFVAPWGEVMKLEAGGALILGSASDIYGIQKSSFENTYASTGRSPEECLQEILNMFGITRDDLEAAKLKMASSMNNKPKDVDNEKTNIEV